MRFFRLPIFFSVFFVLAACKTISVDREAIPLPEKQVILTFDDGPNPDGYTTARLLDILKEQHIQAVFPLLGENAAHCPGLVKRIYDEGHLIANHGYCDHWAIWHSEKDFEKTLLVTETVIDSILGNVRRPRLYRPHGGYYLPYHEKVWTRLGFKMIPVNIRAFDSVCTEKSRDKIVRRVLRKLEKQRGGIVLLHDASDGFSRSEEALRKKSRTSFDRTWVPDAVEEIIVSLRERGFVLDGFDILKALHIEDDYE